ncbi:MAG: polysaccharide deacetylase family protein [Anaerolineae bacterium]|nr:polysaccharide deacetylase family protein [Anaerolineae bacterium]
MRRSLCRLTLVLLLTGWLLADLPWAAPARAGESLDATRRRIRVPVLMYHYISTPPPGADKYRLDLSVTPAQFAAQLAWLRANGYTTVTLGNLYDALTAGAPLPPRPVILTFDDGYADAYAQAFPLLREAGMVGTFFVVTEWLDNGQAGYLTWGQAREMAAAGMAIESHSRSHPDLTNDCDYDCRVYQVLGSVETIAAEIGVRPRFFCYPGGRYDAGLFAVLEAAGIVAAVTTHGGTLHVSERLLELPRVRVRGTTTLREFAWMVSEWRK